MVFHVKNSRKVEIMRAYKTRPSIFVDYFQQKHATPTTVTTKRFDLAT